MYLLLAILLILYVLLRILEKCERIQSSKVSVITDGISIVIISCVLFYYLFEPNYVIAVICAIMLAWSIYWTIRDRFSKGE